MSAFRPLVPGQLGAQGEREGRSGSDAVGPQPVLLWKRQAWPARGSGDLFTAAVGYDPLVAYKINLIVCI